MKTTLLGGVLFLIPLVFIVIILGKAYEFSTAVAGPTGQLLGMQEGVDGYFLVEGLSILLIVALCLIAGLAARLHIIRRQVDRLDSILIELIPGYSIAKSMVGGMASGTDAMATLKPVLARFDDNAQIAFEVDRTDTVVVVFLPGAPGAWSGTSVGMEPWRVTPLDLPPHQAAGLLRVLGRGSAALMVPGMAAPLRED
ncbi:hypothetical protein BV911_01700 [Pseudoruegeria sp. SK021]|nr:hypothetical protein BV911_01700 [Pseudoruegeria sp. SK021]